MKKLLLSSAAVCGLVMTAAPAHAQVQLDVGGYFKGYGVFVDQDEAAGTETRDFDILRNTEVHFTGETTLDNGLTVGFHVEGEGDNDDSVEIEESYAYFTGSWGRVNFGAENGAAFLLQVEAPSADSNVDGIRQYVNGVNYGAAAGTAGTVSAGFEANDVVSFGGDGVAGGGDDVLAGSDLDANGAYDIFEFDYDDDVSGYSNKITYLTPIFGGFQLGASYTPENDSDDANGTEGVNLDDEAGDYGDVMEIGVRYEGQFDQVGVIVGGGFTHAELEDDSALLFIDANADGDFDAGETLVGELDDRQSWNVGLDLDIGAFGIGAAYVEDDLGLDGDGDRDTFVIGADYTTGPFKLGASYYNQDQDLDAFLGDGTGDLETDRYTGGVVYTYGPGMTFRGSVSYIEHDVPSSDDIEATSVMLGTQINF